MKRVTGVTLETGEVIECEKAVISSGQWSRQLGQKVGVNIPLHTCEHFYVTTQTMPGCHPKLPVLRDPDQYLYMREWGEGLLVGCFEPNAKPIWSEGVPKDFAFGLLPDDWDHFMPMFEGAMRLIPSLETAPIQQFLNGPESFTTDNQYILGEAPELRNMFVAAGFNSSGIASAGGAGKALAEWIHHGEATMDLWPVDIRRFGNWISLPFLRDRSAESLGLHYTIGYPRKEFEVGRNLRQSPLYARQKDAGAVFGQKFGWERANWFEPPAATSAAADGDGDGSRQQQPRRARYSFDKPSWFDRVGAECRHTRRHVSVFDTSSFSKFTIQGPGAERFLQRLCANNVCPGMGEGMGDEGGTRAGRYRAGPVVYTGMLNARGGFESDVTVTRLGDDEFMVVSPTAQATRDMDWMKRNLVDGEVAVVTDVTSAFCTLAVMGPESRRLMERLILKQHQHGGGGGGGIMSHASFPFSTWKTIDLGMAKVRATRISYVGELGWELTIPAESACYVYDALFAAAAAGDDGDGSGKIDLRNAGTYAIESLRIEKGYRAWGHDLDVGVTPLEAGLGFAVDFDKPCGTEFIGRGALLAQREAGVGQRLGTFVLSSSPDDTELMLWGNEPIYMKGHGCVGNLTSVDFSHHLGAIVGMGFVTHPDVAKKGFFKAHREGAFEIDAGERGMVPATAQLAAVWDSKNTSMLK
jgi:4-methylaminobutanoate oxidase (formaldehyde-forming)